MFIFCWHPDGYIPLPIDNSCSTGTKKLELPKKELMNMDLRQKMVVAVGCFFLDLFKLSPY